MVFVVLYPLLGGLEFGRREGFGRDGEDVEERSGWREREQGGGRRMEPVYSGFKAGIRRILGLRGMEYERV